MLDICAVEVDFRSSGEVVEGSGEAKDVPEEGAGGCNLVDVEARIYEGDRVEDVAEDVAAFGTRVGRIWERAWGWEGKIGVEEGRLKEIP